SRRSNFLVLLVSPTLKMLGIGLVIAIQKPRVYLQLSAIQATNTRCIRINRSFWAAYGANRPGKFMYAYACPRLDEYIDRPVFRLCSLEIGIYPSQIPRIGYREQCRIDAVVGDLRVGVGAVPETSAYFQRTPVRQPKVVV